MKKIITLVLCTVLIIAITGCAAQVDPLIGEWKLADALEQQAEMNGMEVADPILVFEENDKVVFNDSVAGSMEGTYSFKNNKVTLIFPGFTGATYAFGSDTPVEDPVYDFVEKDDGSYSLQMQGEDSFIKK